MNFDRFLHLERCRSKKWFTSENEALDLAAELKERMGWVRYAYQCAMCQLWHLSSSEPEPDKNAKLRAKEENYRKRASEGFA